MVKVVKLVNIYLTRWFNDSDKVGHHKIWEDHLVPFIGHWQFYNIFRIYGVV